MSGSHQQQNKRPTSVSCSVDDVHDSRKKFQILDLSTCAVSSGDVIGDLHVGGIHMWYISGRAEVSVCHFSPLERGCWLISQRAQPSLSSQPHHLQGLDLPEGKCAEGIA
jgi:hypothetical protein